MSSLRASALVFVSILSACGDDGSSSAGTGGSSSSTGANSAGPTTGSVASATSSASGGDGGDGGDATTTTSVGDGGHPTTGDGGGGASTSDGGAGSTSTGDGGGGGASTSDGGADSASTGDGGGGSTSAGDGGGGGESTSGGSGGAGSTASQGAGGAGEGGGGGEGGERGDDSPVAVDDAFDGAEDVALAIDYESLLVNDTGAVALTADMVAIRAASCVGCTFVDDPANERLTVTPDANFAGDATLEYTITVDAETSNVATVTIGFVPVNDAPVVTNLGMSVAEGSSGNSLTGRLTATDVDQADENLVFTVSIRPHRGTLRRSGVAMLVGSTFTAQDVASGIVTYQDNGVDPVTATSFTLSLADGQGSSATVVVAVDVTPVDDPPYFTATDYFCYRPSDLNDVVQNPIEPSDLAMADNDTTLLGTDGFCIEDFSTMGNTLPYFLLDDDIELSWGDCFTRNQMAAGRVSFVGFDEYDWALLEIQQGGVRTGVMATYVFDVINCI